MPRMTANKEDLTGGPQLPEGMYDVIVKGFKPKKSKGGDSVNLNPDIRVVNNATFNDRKVFFNMNSNGAFLWPEFCHAFGCPLVEDGEDVTIPGSFDGPEDDPTKWVYNGPLLNQQGKLIIGTKTYQGKTQADIKQFICRVPGCTHKHSDNLIKA